MMRAVLPLCCKAGAGEHPPEVPGEREGRGEQERRRTGDSRLRGVVFGVAPQAHDHHRGGHDRTAAVVEKSPATPGEGARTRRSPG